MLDFKISAHARMNGYYRGDDIDDGIIKHSTWLIDTREDVHAGAARRSTAPTIVTPTSTWPRRWRAAATERPRAMALLTEAKTGWSEIRNADRMLDPVIARYALVGTVGAPITAPRWLNAPASTTHRR